ncbi:hypothetical protein ACIRD3_07865 [Kitasatospora sp. NPDC093550]|uniref:hypothetical protein n=1 Tax=Kitasatospora sp. NPDC093550 TaxID=3364089 RepID=UPI003824FAA0
MDSGIEAMVEAVRTAKAKIREDALPKAREGGRDMVPEAAEAALLGALAELLDSVGELAEGIAGRMTTSATRRTYRIAGKRLRDEASNLKGDAEDAVARVK